MLGRSKAGATQPCAGAEEALGDEGHTQMVSGDDAEASAEKGEEEEEEEMAEWEWEAEATQLGPCGSMADGARVVPGTPDRDVSPGESPGGVPGTPQLSCDPEEDNEDQPGVVFATQVGT